MRKLIVSFVVATVSLAACGEPQVNSWETPEALMRKCTYAADISMKLIIHSGRPESEIKEKARKNLSPCRALDDELFIEIAKKEVEKDLKDPSSVQYEDVRRTTLLAVDGKLNAKNSYGAYTGFKRFRVELSSETGKWDARIFKY